MRGIGLVSLGVLDPPVLRKAVLLNPFLFSHFADFDYITA